MRVLRARLARSWAILLQRCPRCMEGKVFKGSFTMNETCPSCGLVFGREVGYFMGAMYFSYGMAVAFTLSFALAIHLLFPSLTTASVLLFGWIAFWPFVPWTFRESRVIWMHFDRWMDRVRGAEAGEDATPRKPRDLPMAK